MTHMIRFMALVIALAIAAYAPVQADSDTEGDWEGGWNTWKTSKKGDWIETAIEGGIRTRWEVTKVEGGKISATKKTFAGEKETSSKEFNKGWSELPLTMKLPYKKEFKWTEEVLDLSGVKLDCKVASWVNGEAAESVYYCKDVPCGGFVKSVTNGKDIVWLSAFHTEKSGDVKADPKEATPAVKSELPRFYATEGNSVITRISGTGRDASWKLRTIGAVAEKNTKYSEILCDEAGTPLESAKLSEKVMTKEDWGKLYAKPSETNTKVTVPAGEYVCDVYKSSAETSNGTRETTEWISEGVPVKVVIKSGETETILEAIKVTMK